MKNEDHIRITHVATGANLHSHKINYTHPKSSGQQQVTAYKAADYNDVWVIKDSATNPIKHDDSFRLQHLATEMYLHSHPNIPAPITTSQQEVTGWKGKDENDVWRVEVEGGGEWTVGKRIRLIHVATNAALHSHNIAGGTIPNNQVEVTAFAGRDGNDLWTADYASDTVPPPGTVNPPTSGPYAYCVQGVFKDREGRENNFKSTIEAPEDSEQSAMNKAEQIMKNSGYTKVRWTSVRKGRCLEP